MKIVASLSVKDEVELIERAIAHLRAIGVDHIIACDLNSSDGTQDILQSYRSDDDFWLYRLSDADPHDFEPWIRASVALVKSAEADWAIFLDADEFWLPASGRLDHCAALDETDVLIVDRFNVPVGPDGPLAPVIFSPDTYGELSLIAEPIANPSTHLRDNPGSLWIRGKVEPKVMARPDKIGRLELAAHNIEGPEGAALRRRTPADLLIAHLPFTSRDRFRRKVDNIRKVFSVHDQFFGEATAWHWRRWLELADRGELDAEYDATVSDQATLDAWRGQGVVRTAAEMFAARGAND